MAIFLRQSHNIKPAIWGSHADVLYAVQKNAEKVYGINPENLVLAMPMWEGAGDVVRNYSEGDGVNQGAIWTPQGLYFNGSVSIDCGYHSKYLFGTGDNWTVLARINIEADGDILRIDGPAPRHIWLFRVYATKLNIVFGNTGGTLHQSNSVNIVTSLKWHSVMGVVNADQDKVYLYMDGIEEANDTDSSSAWSTTLTKLYIGAWAGSGQFFDGFMDNVHIFSIALTAEQIALFNDLPYGLYQPVNRPVYFFPTEEMPQHMLLLGIG